MRETKNIKRRQISLALCIMYILFEPIEVIQGAQNIFKRIVRPGCYNRASPRLMLHDNQLVSHQR